MQRVITIALGVAVVVLAAVLMVKSMPPRATVVTTAAIADASAAADGSSDESASDDDAGAIALPDLAFAFDAGAPALAANAPKQVRFGVVLVTYAGAQGAPAKARSKKDALALAEKLAEDAKSDFKGAVQRGDSGSAEDMGTVPRGVLEPGPESVLFSLPAGGTSGAIDTPRGFWIVKRLE